MTSPGIAPTGNNGTLGANGHDEKPDLTTDSPDEMSDDDELVGDRSDEHLLGDRDANGVHERALGNSEGGGSDNDRESEDEDTDDEDEEEEEEPALKYERIGSIQDLLKKDSASALAISNKLLVNISVNEIW
jgi:vacuolar protein sorting-associated protein 41